MFLVRKRCGVDEGKLYAMKVLKKASIVQKLKTAEHTRTERQVSPILITYFCDVIYEKQNFASFLSYVH